MKNQEIKNLRDLVYKTSFNNIDSSLAHCFFLDYFDDYLRLNLESPRDLNAATKVLNAIATFIDSFEDILSEHARTFLENSHDILVSVIE